MILSDRTIREQLAAGRIVIEPFDDTLVQPSSVDVRLDRLFRVFRNHTAGVIDVKEDHSTLTELVEIGDDGVFMLHPGEFVLGSTLERVAVPDDLVARIEGKSSLGRLGLLIHSSLPASEPLLVLDDRGLVLRTIGEIVKEPRPCRVVSFDPTTFAVGYHEVTGTYEGPPDRIYEVRLASGRSVRVTAGHNLFALDPDGSVRKVQTLELVAGTQVAVPRRIPAPPAPSGVLRWLDHVPEAEVSRLTLAGPTIRRAFGSDGVTLGTMLRDAGGLHADLGPDDRISHRGERHSLPVESTVDDDLAWFLGMYAAKGHRRQNEITISNTDPRRLDRLQSVLARLGLPVHRSAGAVVCRSGLFSDALAWLGAAGRIPPLAFGWPDPVLRSLLDGIVDGNGSAHRTSDPATSEGLVADLLLAFARLGQRAAWQVALPEERGPQSGGGLAWDRVVAVVDTGQVEPIFDLEVRPRGHKVENFLAGSGGVFVSNTAGFVDAGFDGHITLELANVASLPITLYPGMKIGQISFMEMTTAADAPYGSGATGSKYQGQRGPTPSRYFENFRQ